MCHNKLYSHLQANKPNLFSCPSVEQKAVLSGEEQERKITTYEEAMNKIKDTTGVSDIKEVVQRFLSQGETQKHLEQLKTNNEKMLVRLKEEKVFVTRMGHFGFLSFLERVAKSGP